MARRYTKRRKPPGSINIGSVLGIIALLTLGCLILGVLGWKYFTAAPPLKLDSKSGCPIDGPRGVTVVLLDASDRLADQSQIQVKSLLENEAQRVPDYALLELRLLEQQTPGGKILFSRCKPADGSNANPLDANPEMMRRNWIKNFKAPLEGALSALPINAEADISPIMQTIQYIALQRLSELNSGPKKLVVISDFMQNTPGYSQYRDGASYKEFKKSPVYRETHTDLRGASVVIYYLQRQNQLPSGTHLQFWNEWFTDNGGFIESAEKLQGVQG